MRPQWIIWALLIGLCRAQNGALSINSPRGGKPDAPDKVPGKNPVLVKLPDDTASLIRQLSARFSEKGGVLVIDVNGGVSHED